MAGLTEEQFRLAQFLTLTVQNPRRAKAFAEDPEAVISAAEEHLGADAADLLRENDLQQLCRFLEVDDERPFPDDP